MPQFAIVRTAVNAAIAGICLVLLHSSERLVGQGVLYVADKTPLNPDQTRLAAFGALVALLMFLFRFTDRLSNALIGSIPVFSPALRYVLSGRRHIEGDWPLVVVNAKTGQLLLEGFLNIDYRDGELHVSGKDWTPTGELALRFRSLRSTYDRNVLRYFYEQHQDLSKPPMFGYTEIYFFPEDARGERHAGEFLDKVNEVPLRFYAKRLRGGLTNRRLRKDAERRAAARQFSAEIAPRLADILRQPIDVDWE